MGKYEIIIDQDLCSGDKMCCDQAPNCFDLNEDGVAYVVDSEGDPDEYILDAAQNCPMEAITLIDKDTGDTVFPAE